MRKGRNVCKEIIEYNIKSEVAQIQLIIHSVGGSCTAGFAVIDIIEWSRIPVYTTGIGMIASMGLLVFMTGSKGHQGHYSPNLDSFTQVSGFDGGQLQPTHCRPKRRGFDARADRRSLSPAHKLKSKEDLEQTLLRDVDTWLSPDEAVRLGSRYVESLGSRS